MKMNRMFFRIQSKIERIVCLLASGEHGQGFVIISEPNKCFVTGERP